MATLAGVNRASWKNPRLLLTLSLIFFCGAIAGAAAMGTVFHHWPMSWSKSNLSWRESGKEISLQRFKKELNLTPTQAEQLETILDDFMMYYQMLQSQMDEVRASGKVRILRVLNEEQKHKFERMLSDLQAKQLR
jgi:Spy/CpxP family protein refolding chaperone